MSFNGGAGMSILHHTFVVPFTLVIVVARLGKYWYIMV